MRIESLEMFRRMPSILNWWMCRVRKTPNAWIVCGLVKEYAYVPRNEYDNGTWMDDSRVAVRAHERAHYWRLTSRPWLSRKAWLIRYMLSEAMAYEEEMIGYRAQLKETPMGRRQSDATEFAIWMIESYKFKKDLDTIMRDLLAGL